MPEPARAPEPEPNREPAAKPEAEPRKAAEPKKEGGVNWVELAKVVAMPLVTLLVGWFAPDGYIPAREEHNLADYDASSGITLKPKKER
jgi:hypothetical protein